MIQKISKVLLLICILFSACKSHKNNNKTCPEETTEIKKSELLPLPPHKITSTGEPSAQILGVVIDEKTGERIPFATVKLEPTESHLKMIGAYTDVDGQFHIKSIQPGTYHLVVESVGYHPLRYKPIRFENMMQIDFKLTVQIIEIELLKPIIYLYPQVPIDIDIQIKPNGTLTHTYPEHGSKGWQVRASPDGTLKDAQNRSYYGLYWESNEKANTLPNTGFVVEGSQVRYFLEEKLDVLGLTQREANEFIIFWLPLLEDHPYCFLHFEQEEYAQRNPIVCTPTPEQSIRIMMQWAPMTEIKRITEQKLERVTRCEECFLLVEWGGSQLPMAPPAH
jgi:CarboxypepD_reg-like domain